MMSLMLRCLLFVASVAGYLMLLNKKYDIAIEFAPAIYCSGVSSVMFFAGILNMMPEIVAVVTAGGVICLLYFAKYKINLSRRTIAVIFLFSAVLLWFAYLLLGIKFTHYDDFSHWGLVVRELLKDNRMPTAANPLVTFSAYPQGSALWIYYVCSVVGLNESIYLFSNQILNLSFLLPLLAWVTKKKWYLAILPLGFSAYALTSNITITSLLVDSMLATAAVAVFAVGIYYRESPNKAALCSAPLLVFLVQLKNSGISFVCIYLIYMAINLRKTLILDKGIRRAFLGWDVILPISSMFLWQKHVKLVFPHGDTSKHAMTIANYKHYFEKRTIEYTETVFSNVFHKGFSLETHTFCLLLLLSLVIFAIMILQRKNRGQVRTWALLLGANWCIFILYLMGLAAMYVLSMPSDEVAFLASFGRYLNTCGSFLFGITILYFMQNITDSTPTAKWKTYGTAILCLVLVVVPLGQLSVSQKEQLLKRKNYSESERAQVQAYIKDLPQGLRYIAYNNEPDLGYLYWILQYEFNSEQVECVTSFSTIGSMEMMKKNADFLFIWTPDEVSNNFLRENGLAEFCGQKGAVIDLRCT